MTHYPEVLERCKHGRSACSAQQVEYLAGFGHLAARIGDAWRYICQLKGRRSLPASSCAMRSFYRWPTLYICTCCARGKLDSYRGIWWHSFFARCRVMCHGNFVGHYPGTHDARNHPKVSLATTEGKHSARLPRPPLAADHNPHILLGNSSVATTVLKFAPRNLKFILLCCHPAKRARALRQHSCSALYIVIAFLFLREQRFA